MVYFIFHAHCASYSVSVFDDLCTSENFMISFFHGSYFLYVYFFSGKVARLNNLLTVFYMMLD